MMDAHRKKTVEMAIRTSVEYLKLVDAIVDYDDSTVTDEIRSELVRITNRACEDQVKAIIGARTINRLGEIGLGIEP